MEHSRILDIIIGIGIGVIIMLGVIAMYSPDNSDCQQIKEILYLETKEISFADQISEVYDYYSLSTEYYDYSDYDKVISYCEKSRRLSEDYSQDLREIKAEYPESSLEIFEVRKEMIETEIDYLFALYESCEYMESAARAYSKDNWAMGDVNIEGQNEAITRHDNLVEEYYNLEARYQNLKLKLLESEE